jgi:hypothetical protein
MAEMIEAESLTESTTQFEPLFFSSGWLANLFVQKGLRFRSSDEGWRTVEPDLVFTAGPSKYTVIEVRSGGSTVREDATNIATGFKDVGWLPFYRRLLYLSAAAESSTSATEPSSAQIGRLRRRNELLRRLTPQRRATYDRIKKLREGIGPLELDVVKELRELRENG